MKTFKTERDWKDIDSASRVVMAVFVASFLGITYFSFFKPGCLSKTQTSIVKTELIRGR